MTTLKEFLCQYISNGVSSDKIVKAIPAIYPILSNIAIDNEDEFNHLKCFHEHVYGCHFNEYFAKDQVSKMYHTTNTGIVCKGEKYSIEVAANVYNNYVRKISRNINAWDVYVALNAQYHDHIIEYMDWFKDKDVECIDKKIVEGAINFWFMDEDAGDNKVWNYFKTIG